MADDSSGNNGDGLHTDLKRWRRVDDLDGLRMRVQRAIRAAEVVLYAEGSDTSERLRAATTIQQAAQTALKLYEVAELERRIERLESIYETAPLNGQEKAQ